MSRPLDHKQALIFASALTVLAGICTLLFLYVAQNGEVRPALASNVFDQRQAVSGLSKSKAAIHLPSSDDPLSKQEKTLVSERSAKLRTLFQQAEMERSKTIEVKEVDEGGLAVVMIREPSVDEIGTMSLAMTANLEDLPPDSVVYQRAFFEFSELIKEFTEYPKPYKFLGLVTMSKDAIPKGGWWGKENYFVEWFSSDEEKGAPKKDGTIPEDVARTDSDWGVGKSWAAKRYGYLFRVEKITAGTPIEAK